MAPRARPVVPVFLLLLGLAAPSGSVPATPGEEPATPVLVPVVLSAGGAQGSYYTTELTFTNRGTGQVTTELRYTAAIGTGSGAVTDHLGPGEQKVVPDAIAHLRSLGLAIPEGQDAVGTLLVRLRGLVLPSDGAVSARTTTRVPEGRAGLAYGGIYGGHTETSVVCGLRQNERDRSNLALVHAGEPGSGDVTLCITVYRARPGTGSSRALSRVTLSPGGFAQVNNVLSEAGFDDGWVRVTRISGTAPYFAYGVINDQSNSDGSFVPSLSEPAAFESAFGVCLPVVVEAGPFTSEVTFTNTSDQERSLRLTFVSDAIQNASQSVGDRVTLAALEQRRTPDFVEHLRSRSSGLPARGAASIAGALFIQPQEGASMSSVVVGGRTAAPGGGGQYGVFYVATPLGDAFRETTWLLGLRQDAENRTNLAIVNARSYDDGWDDEFLVDLFDGRTGRLAASIKGITVPSWGWIQIPTVLASHAPSVEQGYAKVTRKYGGGSFLAYGVVNDGAGPGLRSGDGAYLAAQPECTYSPPFTTQAFGHTGGAATLYFVVTSGCPWSARADVPWITLTEPVTGVGSGSLRYSVAANASAGARSGSLLLASAKTPVYQHGDAPGPLDGTWTGTTKQGKPISLRIERNEVVTLTLGLDLSSGACHAAGTYTAEPATKPAVYQNRFSFTYDLAAPGQASLSLYTWASFGTSTAASGGFSAPWIESGGISCTYVGSGPGSTFTVQKSP